MNNSIATEVVSNEYNQSSITGITTSDTGVFYKEAGWNGFGKVTSNRLSPKQAQLESGLGWALIEGRSLYQDPITDEIKENTDTKVLVRSDNGNYVSTVPPTYSVVQNDTLFEIPEFLVHEGDAHIEAAASLKGGKTVFILLALALGMQDVKKNDPVKPYLLIANGNDGKRALWFKFTPIRVVCQNSLDYALRDRNRAEIEGKAIRLIHNGNMDDKIAFAKQSLNLATQSFDQSMKHYREFTKVQMNTQSLTDYYKNVYNIQDFSKEKQRTYQNLVNLFETGEGTESSTLWDAYNAITQFTRKDRTKESNIHSDFFGVGASTRASAYNEALKLITV